ncbi:hypothetical protein C7H19_23655 [Aphanothece hegewaldii CCALA 016]|uniref:Uncharacterized protein n=1 Tax=Aphanothece hegewaldii CCALA 016 TaxID=2107694 RepID=A0A2T1LR33_9CHRO|nr:hypothetical protein [Aphanothece hegewaldii]PSF30580.1 hypothetical protein C7H19_23655 [Aphanothece hegewaldii CCALA 016]
MTIPLTALGTNCTIVTNGTLPVAPTANNPALVLYFDDIKTAIGWGTPNASNLEPWITAILQQLAAYHLNQQSNNSEDHMIVVSKGSGYNGTTRKNVRKKLFNYSAQIYTTDNSNNSPDGDEF